MESFAQTENSSLTYETDNTHNKFINNHTHHNKDMRLKDIRLKMYALPLLSTVI